MAGNKDMANPAMAGNGNGHATERILVDPIVNVKLKLAVMWATLMFFYIYNDILTMYRQDIVEGLLAGNLEGIQFTQGVLFAAAALMSIPIFMVLLSVTLPARLNRPVNMFMGAFHMVLLVTSTFMDGEAPWAYYGLICVFEGVIIAMITWYAWKWPTQNAVQERATLESVHASDC